MKPKPKSGKSAQRPSATKLSLDEILVAYEPARLKLDPAALTFKSETPAAIFTTVMATVRDSQLVVALVCRDSFDEKLAKTLVRFLREHESELDAKATIQILEGFSNSKPKFDAVLVLGPTGHDQYTEELPALQPRCFLAFPIYRCELAGDETPAEVAMFRRDFVPTLEWQREPHPRLKMRYANTATGGGSKGKKLGFARVDLLRAKLDELTDKGGSFIEIANYRSQQCILTVDRGKFIVADANGKPLAKFPKPKIWAWVQAFLIQGLASPSPSKAAVASQLAIFGIFLSDYDDARHIAADHLVRCTLQEAIDEFDGLSDSKGCFLGLVDAHDATVQFMWRRDGRLDVEFPMPTEGGFRTKKATFDECIDIIRSCADGIHSAATLVPGLIFKSSVKRTIA